MQSIYIGSWHLFCNLTDADCICSRNR